MTYMNAPCQGDGTVSGGRYCIDRFWYHVGQQVSRHRNPKESTMAWLACQLNKTGIYHIVFRGVNHCHLFEAYYDYEKMLVMLASIKADLLLRFSPMS